MTSDTQDDGTEDGTAAASSGPVRYPTAIAVGGGLAAAVGSSFIPMNAIEGFVSAYGIAELLPAAAPPLGNTARLALSTGIGTLTAGALLALLPRGEKDVMGYETVVTTDESVSETAPARGGSGVSKLAGWLKSLRFGKADADETEVTDFGDLNRMRMRMGDQHPDAPVRAPIMANSDLGAPFDSPPETAQPLPLEEPVASDAPIDAGADEQPLDLDATMAFAPPPEGTDAPPAPFRSASMRFAPPMEDPAAFDDASEEWTPDTDSTAGDDQNAVDAAVQAQLPSGPSDLADVPIADLLDRLERGLVRRRELALAAPKDVVRPAGRITALHASPNIVAADATAEVAADTSPRFRLRMTPATPNDVAEAATEAAASITDDDAAFELEAPAVSADALLPDAETVDVAIEAPAAPADEPATADEDMDAALRDALATLRQLSDRQRNA